MTKIFINIFAHQLTLLMKRIFTISLGLAILSSASLSILAAPPAVQSFDLTRFQYKAKNTAAFKGERVERINRINSLMYPLQTPAFAAEEPEYQPNVSFGPANNIGDLDGPNGEPWYYTAFYEYEVIPADYDNGIWFDDYILRSFRYDIYDTEANLVGSIKDIMRYEEDEERAVYYDLTPFVSRNFFNTSDDIELGVGFGVNSRTPGNNHYRTLIYSIGGPKDANGNDEPIMVFPELISDVAEGPASADGRDNFYIAFSNDVILPEEEEGADGSEPDSYWDYLTRQALTVNIMGRAENNEGPSLIHTQTIPLINLPGDQEGSPFMFNLNHDGKLYYLFNYLQKPLWERYDDPFLSDMVQRPDNNLQIFLYSIEGKSMNLLQTTLIPTIKDADDPGAIASFYSVGDMRYKEDVVFEGFGQPEGKADFYITRINYTPSSDSSTSSFYAYDYEGKKLRTYAEYCNSTLAISDLPGFEPQQMFVQVIGGAYQMTFIDLYSGNEAFATSNYYSISDLDEPEYIMANVDRTPVGDSYKYAFEMTYPVEIDEDSMLRVLWTNADGSFDHIDMVNVGEGVFYGQFYLSKESLEPGIFNNDDDQREYLYMVKRGVPGNDTTEDVGIGQPVSDLNPEGKTLLSVAAGEKGSLYGIVPYLYGENKHLNIYFFQENSKTNQAGLSMDIYNLPLKPFTGISSVENGNNSLRVNGSEVSAAGLISVYSPSGALIAKGNRHLNLSDLPKGFYIVEADGECAKIRL